MYQLIVDIIVLKFLDKPSEKWPHSFWGQKSKIAQPLLPKPDGDKIQVEG
jgi:hypothetical protein